MKNRRDFLKLCAAATVPVVGGTVLPSGSYRTPSILGKYLDPLPIPKTMKPVGKENGVERYHVRMVEFERQLHSQLPPTRLWGYDGQYPGPSFEAMRGQPIAVVWENALPMQHLFPIDPMMHGAMAPSPAVRTVPHLHGSQTDSVSDGLPELWFPSGKSALYHYPNQQPAATLWYHDHADGITRLNAYAGLTGLYLLRDADELRMDLPRGEYEIPLILQDRTLDDEGQLLYARHSGPGVRSSQKWFAEFYGELPVVNGAIYPYLEVEPRPYRFRLLNSANSRFFRLFLNRAKTPFDVPKLVPFQQIGTDGGFLGKPVTLDNLLLTNAERADLIVDFSGLEGETITLSNNAPAPFPGYDNMAGPGQEKHAALAELMQIRVTKPLVARGKAFSMPPLKPLPALNPATAVRTRDFALTEIVDKQDHSHGMFIDGKRYSDPLTETVKLNTAEVWRFINTTEDAHPMHVHLVQFRVVSRQGFDMSVYQRTKQLQLVGPVRPPEPYEQGWKDTAVVSPGEVLTIVMRFEGFTGKYVYHCHMLEHEDNDMMRPFEVIA